MSTSESIASEGATVGLHAKLLDAQRSVEAVVKLGQNREQDYKFAAAADVVGVARKALHKAGLVGTMGRRARVLKREAFETGKGTRGLRVEVEAVLKVTDPETGEAEEYVALGAGADYGAADKAVAKAQTGATKYAYAAALALAFVDLDPDLDLPGEAARAPKASRPIGKAEIKPLAALQARAREAGIEWEHLTKLYGAAGADAPARDSKPSREKAIRSLTTTQAEQLGNLLDAWIAENGKGDG